MVNRTDFLRAVAKEISAATGVTFQLRHEADVGGGCINSALVLSDGARRFFLKHNAASHADMFAAEANGLTALAAASALRVPMPVCHGVAADRAYIVLEHLTLTAHGDAAALGAGLARQHAVTHAQFGWERDNTIGSTPQINTPCAGWPAFWRDRRLGFQLALAAEQGYGGALQRNGERLLADIDSFFTDYMPRPALLHGDLWSGNFGFDGDGRPVVFDPAVYFGDREADLAMTELFGGFASAFYSAYRAAAPLDSGYAVRKTLYNLYHVLNHLNLFGGGYRAQAERMLESLLAELRA